MPCVFLAPYFPWYAIASISLMMAAVMLDREGDR